MPIKKSAMKALRQAGKRKVLNTRRKNTVKTLTKQLRGVLVGKKYKEARELMPALYKALDKAAKVGAIKKNTASRKKSRLSALVKRESLSVKKES